MQMEYVYTKKMHDHALTPAQTSVLCTRVAEPVPDMQPNQSSDFDSYIQGSVWIVDFVDFVDMQPNPPIWWMGLDIRWIGSQVGGLWIG